MPYRFLLSLAASLVFATPLMAQSPAKPLAVDNVLVTIHEQVQVPSREAGVLEKLAVREGQLVEAGALVAGLDDADAHIAERQARLERDIAQREAQGDAAVKHARLAGEVARSELERAKASAARRAGSVSETELDRLALTAEEAAAKLDLAQEKHDVAKLAAELAEAKVAEAQANLERRRIVAPAKGAVVQIYRRRGEWTKPGDPVLRLLRLDVLRAEGFLQLADLGEDISGRVVTLSVELPGGRQARFAGRVAFVSPEVNPVNGQVRFWAEIENPDLQLRPGMTGGLEISASAAQATP
jgi:multidrug efflux pump subunit AcrA (membrane-fusion protein)